MDTIPEPVSQESQPRMSQLPPPADSVPQQDDTGLTPEQKRTMIGIGIVILVILIAIGVSIYLLGFVATPAAVTRVRDIFIILMALLSLFTGFALVILILQVTRLINLLQNEIRPILNSTNETVSTLRGTTAFLSNNLVEPVIKLNEYLAGFGQLLQIIGAFRKSTKK
jgi:hypothetical protein